MVYVDYVSSTMKCGCSVQLGPKTLIVGPNGSGKTTILQAIELATCGCASDLEGRNQVKQSAALARLFPEGAAMEVTCTLSDETVFSWQLSTRGEDGFKTPEHVAPVNVRWPFQELKAILTGDATTVGSWLESQIIGEVKEVDLLRSLPPEVRSDVNDLAQRAQTTDFIALSKFAKDEARNLRLQATKSEKTVVGMTRGIAPPLLDEERKELQDKLSALQGRRGNISASDFAALKQQLDAAMTEYMEYEVKVAALPALDTQAKKDFEVLLKLERIQEIQLDHASQTQEICLVCGKGSLADFKKKAADVEALLVEYRQKAKEIEDQQILQQRLATRLARLQEIAEQVKSAVVKEDSSTQEQELQQTLMSDMAAKRTWDNAAAARLEIAQSRARADRLTTASGLLATAGKELLDKKKKVFEAAVSSFLPQGEKLGVDIKSSRLGLVREGHLHSALSGAEWSRVLLALASATTSDSTPCILAPEDRAWDRDTLQHVMEAVAASPVQIILMSTVPPTSAVEGWTIVEVPK